MKRLSAIAFLFALVWLPSVAGREAKLLRYPHYHQGKIVFTYLGDIWTADETGQNIRRITVHKARDVYPRFSPDGKWIAFSSDRNGNNDVFIIPAEGGAAKQLTFHSADDTVQGWSPDGKSVLFASQRGEDFMGKLYTVNVDDLKERNAGADMGVWATYSPDGKKLAVNRKGQTYWRKYYRGSYQTDVTVMDIASKKFTDVTDFNGEDSWPMWSRDGHIYFVSDRDGGIQANTGLTNIWRTGETGGKAEKVTSFTAGDVRWPAMSSDGKTIVFEHDFGVWKLDVATKKATPIKLDISAETQENLAEVRDFNSQVDDYDLAPSGRRIAFTIHGEIFTAPTEEGELRQITDSPWRDKDPQYSPDGKWIAFVSDRSGREEIYVASVDGTGEAQKISDQDTLKNSMSWSPNSKELAFTGSDNKLRKYNFDSKQTAELASSKYGNLNAPVWSPDGKWLAYSKADDTRNSDIYLIPSAGGEERKVTFDSFSDVNPRFSADGKKLYFVRNENTGGGGADRSGTQIHVIALERQDKDPNDPDETAEPTEQASGRPGGNAAQRNQAPKEVNIDWAGLKRRTRQVTRMAFGAFNYTVAPDSRTIVFVSSEPSNQRNTPVIYSIQDDGRRLTRIASGAGGDEAGGGGRGGGRGGFGGGLSGLTVSRDGRTLFFREGDGVYSVSLAGGNAGAPPTAGRTDGARRRVSFVAKVKIEKPTEWAEMFDDAWRTMKYRFYDPKMHGMDWDAMRSKYQPLVADVGDRQELLNIINEMIGELNASHTGAAPGPGGNADRVTTGHLGLELESDEAAGRYKVTHVYETGPADKDWVKVSVGDYLLSINGKPVRAGDNYWPLLNSTSRLNRKVAVTFNNKPAEDGAWTTRIEPIASQAYSQLRYERWVKQRGEMVAKLSGGRIGYLHIQAMDQPSLRKFEKEIRENRNKEALVIDQRFNGGGNIEQELLAILVQRQYQIWEPRGTEATGRPFAGFFGPKVVLQNWRSASNAEMFPAGFRALGLGKTVGTPTMGAVIGTGSYSLIDGSTVRTPGVGVFLADQKRTNMENFGVQPDILIENTPEDNLAGRDRQLETAVQELLKELQKKSVAKKE
ncbi:MAG TPA: S41 family peptidase [Blastocatellia bacterium]|nr:S41 family peptidase [Blastocatellia bacterium]HNG33652.1 S41 family peptidase [Blastocatellia bacterium]